MIPPVLMGMGMSVFGIGVKVRFPVTGKEATPA